MTNPLAEAQQSRLVEPCSLVIFGATGDLTARKIVPALYNLLKDGQLPSLFTCIGFARRPKNNEIFRAEMKDAVGKYSRTQPLEESIWSHFQDHLFYHQSEFHEAAGYENLKALLDQFDTKYGTKGNRIFYLATQPHSFPVICENLHKAGLIYDEKKVKDQKSDKWSRVVIEKPFGQDLKSAHELQDELLKFLSEKQIFRIDHYLGKETVQNLLVFRFANSIFESLWNNRHIDHIQITVAEDIGIGTRGKFYENAGQLRDMVQNHVMQLLSLVAMEPPVSLEADAIRDQKVKALESIRPLKIEEVVRGQYGPGLVNGVEAVGYRQEPDVNPQSNIETYLALKLLIDNSRWSGVPFYLRAGKRLPKKTTEIAVIFKDPPVNLFQNGNRKNPPNVLVIRIQPDEGSSLKINCKVPGPTNTMQPVKMDFRYGSYFGTAPPEAYERLICDCIVGDSTLFARQDEVFNSWKLLTPLLDNWAKNPPKDFPNYPAGSWGPKAADQLIEKDGRKWRLS
ncbi:MAG TPA: glucose-6-phosphate dehydrogenase [Rhabdochlamydiaceae bacterium]|jgi:glucose-6-phosphate 1-dehydrogenase|nr:glucose-6-phosphate dehydrogenase [Rhabdochlamydiaceae bacterium]